MRDNNPQMDDEPFFRKNNYKFICFIQICFVSLYPKLTTMKYFEKVKKELTDNNIDWVLGSETDWNENSLIFDGGDCKILLYVKEDDNGKMFLDYYDLFEEGEYNIIAVSYTHLTLPTNREV